MLGSSAHRYNQNDITSLLRQRFPSLRNLNAPVYLDNAATTQIPESVITVTQDYLMKSSANPGRGEYEWAVCSQEIVSRTRQKVKELIQAKDTDGIIYTSGTTMSLNMVVQCWAKQSLNKGDEVLICYADHHSMVLPWKVLEKEIGIKLISYKLNQDGSINLDDLRLKVSDRTKLCCVTHINNTAGWINNLESIREVLPQDILLNVDAAQSVSHVPINVEESIDFLSFSGHKMFAYTGIGVLYCSERVREHMVPFLHGGSMAEALPSDPLWKKMEAGSLNMAGIVALEAAIDFLNSHRSLKSLEGLTVLLYKRLLNNPRIDLLYEQKTYALDRLAGIASFTIEGWNTGELGDLLADHNIFVRTGRHCAGVEESLRVSLQLYNTPNEINYMCDLLDELSETYL